MRILKTEIATTSWVKGESEVSKLIPGDDIMNDSDQVVEMTQTIRLKLNGTSQSIIEYLQNVTNESDQQ
jgi:hypothetical protein